MIDEARARPSRRNRGSEGPFVRWRAPPSIAGLIEAARRRTGLSDFGDIPFERSLQ